MSERDAWDASATHWARNAATLDRACAPLDERLVELARIDPGARVLECAAGASAALARQVLERVGPGGDVIATDFAANMVRHLAAELRGRPNARCVRLDLNARPDEHEPELRGFDAVLCKFGLMHAADPVRAAAGMRERLRSGGRLAVLVWSTPARAPLFGIPRALVDEVRGGAGRPGPGPFALGADGALRGVLTAAEFGAVRVESAVMRVGYRDPGELFELVCSVSGSLRRVHDALDAQGRRRLRERFEERVPAAGPLVSEVWLGEARS